MKKNNYKYKPIKILGQGSYGKAYLVECNNHQMAVIKSIPIDLLSDKEVKEAYFEAKILEKLDHPNIIKFREIFVTKNPNSNLNIVMDYAEGGDLFSKIKSRKKHFAEFQILDWFTQICLALKHIHDRKILHRDLKSQNIFLTKNNLIKLGDFGIAKCLNYTLEQVQTVLGTPYYLSPEIVQNKPYSFKSDIWSLGVILYELCALKMPFNALSLPKLSLNIIKGTYSPLPIHFSKDLRELVSSMLQLDPNKRPTVSDILKCNVIRSRIKNFLSQAQFNKEFSHTILHKFQIINPGKDSGNKRNLSQNFIKQDSNSSNDINIKRQLSDDKKDNISSHKQNVKDINEFLAKKKKEKNYIFEKKSSESATILIEDNDVNNLENFLTTIHKKIDCIDDKKELNSNSFVSNDEDLKDLIHSHKMLIELANLDSENQEEKVTIEIEENNDVYVDDIIDHNNISLSITNDINSNIDSIKNEYSELELIKQDLNNLLGETMMNDVYKIINDNTNHKLLNIDIELIQKLIKENINDKECIIDLIFEKIPEIYSLIIKERQLSINI